MSEAFVYLWRNAKTNKYYLGSHKGTIDDGYTHSSNELPDFPKQSKYVPDHWTRRILAYGTLSEMQTLEDRLHVNRKAKCWNRYYNVQVSNNSRKLPPIKWLHECFELDADTGTLIWKKRPLHHFKTTKGQKVANTRCAGKEAGLLDLSRGYYRLKITWNGVYSQWKKHRVVWAMHYGQWPTKMLDHIDGNKENNAITNLREVTVQENARNRRIYTNNTSGHIGIVWDSQVNKWRARIGVGGKRIGLGAYPNIEDAIAARQAAEIKYGYHENHGRS
jgi:hypothetical protein